MHQSFSALICPDLELCLYILLVSGIRNVKFFHVFQVEYSFLSYRCWRLIKLAGLWMGSKFKLQLNHNFVISQTT